MPDFANADLTKFNLAGADLSHANLTDAQLVGADLSAATLIDADLTGANLTGADLTGANLFDAILVATDLTNAKLCNATLSFAMFRMTDLKRTDFNGAHLFSTVFSDSDLSEALGLDTCHHDGPSVVDHSTLAQSKSLPLEFLRGVGLPEFLIEYLPSLFDRAIQYYSCFISYSTKDQDFADRLHADLQDKGIRCWFAPHDMPIGGKIQDEIDTAIRLRDKVLLILSEHSIKSDWVEDEVTKAFEEERKRGQIVLFPIRLDDAVMDTDEAWAAKLRARHIGDFTRWKEHDEYLKSFERVLRDLTVKKP